MTVQFFYAGQERKLVPGAEHTSCTVEVMSLHKEVDVAVIDEIQVTRKKDALIAYGIKTFMSDVQYPLVRGLLDCFVCLV